jgi:nitrate/TMAO reductase-like tetraheme cytochrome c subunit
MTFPHWRFLALGALVAVLAVLGGVGFVSYQEQDNRFCISCHTQPETEYFDRNTRADATQSAEDLASFHHRTKEIRCIDCHVGEGFFGRAQVVSIAAWDAFKHYTGLARQPATIVIPVQNEACVKCHEQDIQKTGFDNHYHNEYFDPKLSPPFISCTHCHVTHRVGDERTAFQFRDAILPRCEYCHQQVGRGPRGQATPLQ